MSNVESFNYHRKSRLLKRIDILMSKPGIRHQHMFALAEARICLNKDEFISAELIVRSIEEKKEILNAPSQSDLVEYAMKFGATKSQIDFIFES